MTSMPLVSVIVALYNKEAYLKATLESVQQNDYPNWEVIIVDDGSSDDSAQLAKQFCDNDARFRFFQQENRGVSAARNHALREARGEFVLPLDADDLIAPDYISSAMAAFQQMPHLKVVYARAEFIGEKSGPWKLPKFNRRALAMHNQIYISALYRRADALAIGGYCEELNEREDWEFWISMLKHGGDVHCLDQVGLYYRIVPHSKRKADRRHKKKIIAFLNRKHKDFFLRELNGPLRNQKSCSRLLNFFAGCFFKERYFVHPDFTALANYICSLPTLFSQSGTMIHDARNQLKLVEQAGWQLAVKSYRVPHLINRVVYGWLRPSKARRSYEYAEKLLSMGLSTPRPVGYYESSVCGLFSKSYYVCLKSDCPHSFVELIRDEHFPDRLQILEDVAVFTARLHQAGCLHLDYSAGNILFERIDGHTRIEIIDLNRMQFGQVGLEKGCRNFERLPLDEEGLATMAKAYARARGFDPADCLREMKQNR